MSQDLPVTSYAILGLLTFGDELTGYEVKQRAEFTLRFYWVAPAMSQIYSELRRLTERELVRASSRPDAGRDVTTYAITDVGQETLRAWLEDTPAGFPVLKHTVLLRMLMSNASNPTAVTRMLEAYVDELAAARAELATVRQMLSGSDSPGKAFRYAALVADWGLDYFAAEACHARRAIHELAEDTP